MAVPYISIPVFFRLSNSYWPSPHYSNPLLTVLYINFLFELLCGFYVFIGLYGQNFERYTWLSTSVK